MSRILIAICGAKRCGKNTLCSYLAPQLLPHSIRILSTVDIINAIVSVNTGRPVEEFEKLKDENPRWRIYQQTVGDMLRERGTLFIIKEVGKLIHNDFKEDIYLINGIRYPEESVWVKERGGSTIRIFNKAAEEKARQDPHRTEQNIDKIPYEWSVKNEGTLLDLEREARWVAGFIKTKYKLT